MSTRPNSYPGTCTSCAGHVPAAAGLLGGKVDGRWTVQHTSCPQVGAGTTVSAHAAHAASPSRVTYVSTSLGSGRRSSSLKGATAYRGAEGTYSVQMWDDED